LVFPSGIKYRSGLVPIVIEDSDLEVNLLQFLQKSFSYDRTRAVHGQQFAIFLRTETESESKFRPKVIRLVVVVPRAWVHLDSGAEELVIGKDGGILPVRRTTPALEVAAEQSEFEEQGVRWKRSPLPNGGLVYVPVELAEDLLTPTSRNELGLTG